MTSQNPSSVSVKIAKYTMKADGSRRIGVKAPYYPAAIERFRALGGTWDAGAGVWLFDPRDEAHVRDACLAVYGTDGSPTTLVDLRMAVADIPLSLRHVASASVGEPKLFGLGRELLSRYGRDSRVQLGDGVVIAEGAFTPSGGSMKNPAIGVVRGVIIEVRDVPAVLADQAIAAGWATEVSGSRREPQTQTQQTAPAADDALLAAARAALAALTPEQRMRLLTEALDDSSR